MIFEEGRQLAHFKIIRKLGEGGMGEVYLAEDTRLGRNVALKILRSDFFDDADRLNRFIREAKTAAKISHANVMAIYDLGRTTDEESGRDISYIVMENVTGQTLTDYLISRNLSNNELLRLAEKIAAGLSAAHRLNIVHRDIKPDNIKIDDTGEIKILDFGLAKPLDMIFGEKDNDMTDTASNELTQEGKIMGTVAYMSPEQARGGPVDTRSDIFSFGILLYKMFAGVSPFDGSDKVSVLAKILEGRHEPLRLKNESIPPELDRIIDKCLKKDPNDRYQDTRDLMIDLRSLRRQHDSGISDSVSVSGESPQITKSWIWKLSWKKIVFITVGLFFVAAAAIIGPALYYGLKSLSHGPRDFRQAMDMAKNMGVDINKVLEGSGVLNRNGSLKLPVLPVQANALAILGFENKTGDSELDWLQAGLPEILLTDLAQSGATNLISRSRVLDCLSEGVKNSGHSASYLECVEAARSLGASTILTGTFYKLGDKIRIDARLEDITSGQIILAEKVIGDDPFALVDSLTSKIAQSMDYKIAAAADHEVADIMSSSPEAFREYILGMEKFALASYDSANAYFEKAIEIDSGFALPYMRIGMGYSLRNRPQQAAPYFQAAKRRENRLPVRERLLLDIYTDIWLNQQYDNGLIKAKSFVANYPNDKEVRSFYAILLHTLKKDSRAAIAQLDTVMALDQRFMLALSLYSQIYGTLEEYDKVIEYGLLMKSYYPDLPESYQILMTAYYQLSSHEKAVAVATELLDKLPGNSGALNTLSASYIIQRDFDQAEYYNELIKKYHADDPFQMLNYHKRKANLAFWRGNFKRGMDELFNGVKVVKKIEDSARIATEYTRIADFYDFLGRTDSALYYIDLAGKWAPLFQMLDVYLNRVKWDPGSESVVRPQITSTLEDFRSRFPRELWELVDRVQAMFDSYCNHDTATLIETNQYLLDNRNAGSSTRGYQGQLYVLTGQYEQGKKVLESLFSGRHETTQAKTYLVARYYYGRAEEALGNTSGAVESYREVLRYWSDPDIELEIISDARNRLAELTS